jgi:type IV pilus assembly protein PilM
MVANPFASMSLNSRIKPQLLANDAPSLLVTCGLAMRNFDE